MTKYGPVFLIKFYWSKATLIYYVSYVAIFALQRQNWVATTETTSPQKPKVFIIWPCTEKSASQCHCYLLHFTEEHSVSLSGLEPWSLFVLIPSAPPSVLSCFLHRVWFSALHSVDFFFSLSGTRSQITTCSLHMFSIARETQISHFTFFILNLYGSFGTLSRRTLRRRFSPTHHLLASLVGVR